MKTKEITDIVNGLLKRSFGVGVSGDWEGKYPKNYFGIGRTSDGLKYIGRNLGVYIKKMGEFVDPSGAVLKVYPKYKKRAEEYAKLYKEKFGKDVTIELMEEAME